MHDELVRQARQGDAEAFDSLARMVGDRCLAIAVRILRDVDLAEDAVQAALITAWTELRALRDPSRFEPWLHRILTHACYAEARRRRRWYEGPRILPVEGASGPDEYLTVDDRDLLERAFRRLTAEQRAVLVFHHYLGLSMPEVAVRTRTSDRDREVPPALCHAGAPGQRRRRRPGHPAIPGAIGMTTSRDPDRLIRAFLEEGEEQLDDRVYDVVRATIERKPQRAVIGPWRPPTMNRFLSIGLGAAAVVVALVVGAQVLGSPRGNVGGPGADPTPTADATSTPEPSVVSPTSTPEAFLPEGPFTLPQEDGLAAITVTVPADGWKFIPEFAAIQKGDEVENLPEGAMLFWPWEAGTEFYVYGDPCRWPSTTPETPATTVDEIAAALAAQASRDASEPVDITVGGYTGKAITLHVPEDADPDSCEGGEFATYGTAPDSISRYQQGPGQIDDLWVLDVDGAILIVDASYRQDTPPALIEEMRSIAESATFELP